MQAIVVLSDGDTWTTIEGCSICVITDMETEMLADGQISCQDLHPIYEIGLQGFGNPNPQPEA